MVDSNTIINELQKQKINYDNVLKKMITIWQENNRRPKILLHSCCAPCSTYTLEFLTEYAEVTIFFANSNIYPESEYRRRALVQKKFIEQFNEQEQKSVGFIEAEYKPNEFIQMVQEKKLTEENEGGKRCNACFQMRMDLVAIEAMKRSFDYFGSALTISPQKNASLINQIGLDIQKIYDIKYLPSDFKKNNGYQRSVQMCNDYDIYRQCYCGCVFAAKKQGIDLKAVNNEATFF